MEWRDIPGFAGYKINEDGQVKGPSNQVVKLYENRKGYYEFAVRYRVRVHRAVLLAFEGKPPEGKNVARHLDGDKKNNNKSNLKWGTHYENAQDAIKHGTHVSTKSVERPHGEKHFRSKLTTTDVIRIRERSHTENIKDIHKDYPHVGVTAIRKIARGLKWKHIEAAPSNNKYFRGKRG